MNYREITEITVKNQEELNRIPLDFEGQIYVEFGTKEEPAVISNRYFRRGIIRGNRNVSVKGNGCVEVKTTAR